MSIIQDHGWTESQQAYKPNYEFQMDSPTGDLVHNLPLAQGQPWRSLCMSISYFACCCDLTTATERKRDIFWLRVLVVGTVHDRKLQGLEHDNAGHIVPSVGM